MHTMANASTQRGDYIEMTRFQYSKSLPPKIFRGKTSQMPRLRIYGEGEVLILMYVFSAFVEGAGDSLTIVVMPLIPI